MRKKYVDRSRVRRKVNEMKQKQNKNRRKKYIKGKKKIVYFMSMIETCIKKVSVDCGARAVTEKKSFRKDKYN